MYIVDTSIWIDFFKGCLTNSLKTVIFDAIEEGWIYYNGIILSELLLGCRFKKEKTQIITNFEGFNFINMLREDYINLAETGEELLRGGLTIPLTDLIIYYHAVKKNLSIISKDKHFKLIQNYKNINVISE